MKIEWVWIWIIYPYAAFSSLFLAVTVVLTFRSQACVWKMSCMPILNDLCPELSLELWGLSQSETLYKRMEKIKVAVRRRSIDDLRLRQV